MKRILTITLFALLIFSCKQKNRTDYVINGHAEGVYNGVRVYLKSIDKTGQQIVNDTAIVFNEEFKMNGAVSEPTIHFLSVDGSNGELIFMLENSEIDIEVDKASLPLSKVSGSETNKGFMAFQDGLNAIREESKDVMIAYRQIKPSEDPVRRDSISKELEKIGQRVLEYPLNFVRQNNDTYFSLNLIGLESNKPKFDVVNFVKAFENLSPRLKESEKGKEIWEKLNQLNQAYQETAHLEIGKIAPDFEAPTPDGDIVSLNQLKGKVTIIDFWAAWCGPCRRENPNVVRIYNQYHDQGLEIIGVSLDGQSRQNEPKKAWLEAIEKDNLTWHQVSYLKYFNDPVAQLYSIKSIPATYILDAEGKIAAKNLRGKALELKVQELLNK
jgi:peroxiredoxin